MCTTGGGAGGGGATQEFTTTYSSTWTRSYDQDNSLDISNGDMYQGEYSSTHGIRKSLIGFDYATIQSDLSGATISKVELQLKNKHFYNNSGGTLLLGTHSYTSAPNTWSGGSVDERRSSHSWARLAKKYVDITDYASDLQSGAARGIAIGPPTSTSNTYYSYWAGQNSSDRPVLRITYTK